ncbi:MAG: DNA oxidative demethylase AlkB [Sphingomonadaceae bacterium]
MTTYNLFDDADDAPWTETLAPGAVVLRRFAAADASALLTAIHQLTGQAPLRHMLTPNGFQMSVTMSNCGDVGWVSDRHGYRYDAVDPASGQPWPALPPLFLTLAAGAAAAAGYADFVPDACLINCYLPGTKMSLHQDRDERDTSQPIVSVSLGIPATFQFGGARRTDPSVKVALTHGDVVVWGGPTRLNFHGVLPLKPASHAATGERRFNLTFRKAR